MPRSPPDMTFSNRTNAGQVLKWMPYGRRVRIEPLEESVPPPPGHSLGPFFVRGVKEAQFKVSPAAAAAPTGGGESANPVRIYVGRYHMCRGRFATFDIVPNFSACEYERISKLRCIVRTECVLILDDLFLLTALMSFLVHYRMSNLFIPLFPPQDILYPPSSMTKRLRPCTT